MGELRDGLQKSGLTDLVKDIDTTMREMDNNGSGTIAYSEFLAATMDAKKMLRHDTLWQVFKQFDRENNGVIDMDDLTAIMTGGKTTKYAKAEAAGIHEEIRATMEKYDTKKTGDIQFDEFLAMMQEKTDETKSRMSDVFKTSHKGSVDSNEE